MDWLFPPMLDGTLREHYLMLFGAAGAIALVVGLSSAWIGAHFGAKRAVRRALRDAPAMMTPQADLRLADLTRAIDAIAVEVERISEAQRFTSKLLHERIPVNGLEPPRRREPGTTTPH
jgi:hypothetical protein